MANTRELELEIKSKHIENMIIEKKKELALMDKEIALKDKEIKKLKLEIKNKEIGIMNKNDNNHHDNNLSIYYIKNNYKQGEILKPLNKYRSILNYDIENIKSLLKIKNLTPALKNQEMVFVEYLCSMCNDRLVEYIGELLVKCYRKDNNADQAIWAINITRLYFIVKIMNNHSNTIVWDMDNYSCVRNIMIIPLLKYIGDLLTKYSNGDNISIHKSCTEIIVLINKETFIKKIVKYIAPQFNYKDRQI